MTIGEKLNLFIHPKGNRNFCTWFHDSPSNGVINVNLMAALDE